MLIKCLKYGELSYQSSGCRSNNLNLVEAEVDETKMNVVEDKDNEEALELEAGKERC